MLETRNSKLVFSFPNIHKDAILEIEFQRTFRIPDDGKQYNLPPGLGQFPIEKVETYKDQLPAKWKERGGVLIPMSTSEAMWMSFRAHNVEDYYKPYPFAVKIASGKRSAITGNPWNELLREDDYCVVPDQPWLDGFVVENGVIKQFIAVPLGMGVSVEEQLTKSAEIGGLQIQVFPMKWEEFEKKYEKQPKRNKFFGGTKRYSLSKSAGATKCSEASYHEDSDCIETSCLSFCDNEPEIFSPLWSSDSIKLNDGDSRCASTQISTQNLSNTKSLNVREMGFGAGGSMKQQVFKDKHGIECWDTSVNENRVFVHIANSAIWKDLTGKNPPIMPLTANDYNKHGYAWFDYYKDEKAVNATTKMKEIKSVAEMEEEKKVVILPENTSVEPKHVVDLSPKPNKDKVVDGQW